MVGKKLLGIIIFTLMGLLLSNFLFAASPLKAQAPEKPKAIDFSLYDINSKKISLSDFKDKQLILFFWTTWCPYCREELSVLSKEYPSIKSKSIEILAINIGEPQYRVESFLKNRPVEFTVLLDSDSQVAASYNLIGVPTFVLIDSSGLIRYMGNALPSDYAEIINSK